MLLWLISLVLASELALQTGSEFRQEFRYRGKMIPGKVLEIEGLNGDVVAGPSGSGEVEVVAEKRSDGGYGEVRLSVVDHARGTTVKAVFPELSDAQVRFLVRVPTGVDFVGKTTNGHVAARNLQGRVEARTINGNIEVRTTGEAVATTVNGSIRASIGAGAQLETVNGNVTLMVADGVGGNVDVEAWNGEVTTGIPYTSLHRDTHFHWSGHIRGGGSRFRLRTINGEVFLEKEQRY